MGKVWEIATGVLVLIGIYLFLVNGNQTVRIINTLASNATAGIKTLQGRG